MQPTHHLGRLVEQFGQQRSENVVRHGSNLREGCAVNRARVAENLSMVALLVGVLLGIVLGKGTVEEGESFDWLLACVSAGPFVVAAAVFLAVSFLLHER